MKQQTVLAVTLVLFWAGPVISSEDVNCGAAGEGYASTQWQDFDLAAAKQFLE